MPQPESVSEAAIATCVAGVDGDVRLRVRARPGARNTRFAGVHDGRLKVDVGAPPVDGKANAVLVKALAGWLDVRRAQVVLAAGAGQRDKTFAVAGVSRRHVVDRLLALALT